MLRSASAAVRLDVAALSRSPIEENFPTNKTPNATDASHTRQGPDSQKSPTGSAQAAYHAALADPLAGGPSLAASCGPSPHYLAPHRKDRISVRVSRKMCILSYTTFQIIRARTHMSCAFRRRQCFISSFCMSWVEKGAGRHSSLLRLLSSQQRKSKSSVPYGVHLQLS